MARQDGYNAQQNGQLELARAYYEQAIQLDPSYAEAYNDLGVIYEALGWPDKAKQQYLKCLELSPYYLGAYSNLASWYEDHGDLQTAAWYWRKRAGLGSPDDPWTQTATQRQGGPGIDWVTASKEALERQRASFQGAAWAQPNPSRPLKPGDPVDEERRNEAKRYDELAVSYIRLHRYPQAIEAVEKALALNPNAPQAHYHAGLLYQYVQKDSEQAVSHLQAYLELHPQAGDREHLEQLIKLLQDQ
ncbi:MAG: tetratricopeptide repeat protein [Candidatus Omnitrophica bacterium]|nr:tetratricopeptide repeat protein [Candidatus Omnitrophota bacterium]MBI3020822.1 tetratricopeptide repeat protein [Candidatus Omnitrophota bacterium]MBI3083590.1 tetratricopeptide repeat protein [Candidatus Omnitrophota bacterium]